MSATPTLRFFHSPHTRSSATLALLEELKADHELVVLNMKAGEQRQPAYLAVNPMGKVPALLFQDVLITEQAAVFMFLADLYPEAGLAPALNDPLRGAYLRWMVFYGSCFEPAVVDRAMKREPAPPGTSPYGDFDTMLNTLLTQLRAGPYLLGQQLSAADLLWGPALAWVTSFKLVPESPEITAYVERIRNRPAQLRAAAHDQALATAQAG
jgi:glutathione S-transferase